MTIEDKLKRLKKERDVRRRSGSVEDAWSRIDHDERLSTKEKLEKLIHLTGTAKPTQPKPVERPAWEPAPRESFQIFENSYRLDLRYGKALVGDGLKIDGRTLTYLSRNEEFLGLDLRSSLFIDLETTGLAGGTGTLAFLVGMGYYQDDRFVVVQYFLGDPSGEARMIDELARFFAERDFKSVVTYNGRAFDVPLLETRFVLQRKKYLLSELPHLDFLFSARSLWRHKHENCRLFHLAREVVAADRSEDIPSAEIPFRYFDYLRSGNFDLIEPILYHNQEDILSLLGLVISGARLFAEEGEKREEAEIDALDLVGVGRVFEMVGEVNRSIEIFERAIQSGLPSGMEVILKEKISTHFKRAKDWDRAVPLWQDISEKEWTVLGEREVRGILNSLRQLAIHFERHTKNMPEALRVSKEGLALARRISHSMGDDFEHRIERLSAKAEKAPGRPAKRGK